MLDSLFAFEGTAALRITPEAGQIVGTSRTYHDAPGGTYGQFIPVLQRLHAASFGQQATILQLSGGSSSEAEFRTNMGIVNAGGNAITVVIDLFYASGAPLASLTRVLPAFGYEQVNGVFDEAGCETMADGYAVVTSTTPGGAFFTYASVVDNRSNDAVFIPAQIQ